MIELADGMRTGLMTHIANYPELFYTHRKKAFLRWLTQDHLPATDYTVTFGYVLGQASHAIPDFARIIVRIMDLLDPQSSCSVLAVDATTDDRPRQFETSWQELMEKLDEYGIQHEPIKVPQFSTKIARLSETRQHEYLHRGDAFNDVRDP